ncbi:Diaminopimelate epimerase [Aequoribacter fuscus]|uniref:Diaminopimelate epimerase n=1 Tax=Aequoribacter fuscus TaxID=2518989 RepID=F3L282_9GAMM|nr:diaminopimelate epimerase [Aequoribacter fuscus]EGG29561.1 Diaminopimelate epimerase [Aequoribacter fuscus]QHJ88955.1 diaminopimelate epimerase [Aequoribacter fuscus]
MTIRFTKMHGLGNDFFVLDLRAQDVELTSERILAWSDRHRGVGFDQLLVLEPATQTGVDFKYRIFNADGSEVEHCGNGARCVARFAQRSSGQSDFVCETARGLLTLSVLDDQQVKVAMGIPTFKPSEIPFVADDAALNYNLPLYPDQASQIKVGALAIGNPHAVVWVSSTAAAPVEELGPILESHPRFPNRVNVGFAERVDEHEINLRVFERGVGETEACGTGACAAAIHGMLTQGLVSPVSVHLPGGTLQIDWQGMGEQVIMTGPATFVYDGELSE